MPLYLFYTMVQKSPKLPKLKSRGGVLPEVHEGLHSRSVWILQLM